MKKQVLIIHGGNPFRSYSEYITFLKNIKLRSSDLKLKKGWKKSIITELGKTYEILNPRMPNGNNAHYREWKVWFEKMIPFLNENLVLIGHSLGGIFLVKYLTENIFPLRIKALILIAAPCKIETRNESLGDFALTRAFDRLEWQVKNIYIMHSVDDPIVPVREAKKYKKAIPGSKLIIFKNRKHFNQESFPELSRLIKNIF